MRIKNNMGHPLFVETDGGPVMIMIGESDIPERVLLDLSKVKGQFAEWVAKGLVEITSTAPTKLQPKALAESEGSDEADDEDKPKKKAFFKK